MIYFIFLGETISQLIKIKKDLLTSLKVKDCILSDQNKLGVDWEAVVNKFHDLDIKSNFNVLDTADKRGTMSIGTLASDNYTALIQALDSEGATNILSSPRITTLNGQEAKILVGSSEPYVTSTTTTPSSGPSTIAESVNFIEVGVKLYVTPQIHKDNFILYLQQVFHLIVKTGKIGFTVLIILAKKILKNV